MAEQQKTPAAGDKVRDLARMLPNRDDIEAQLDELRDDLERMMEDVGQRFRASPLRRRILDFRPLRRLEQADEIIMPDIDVVEEADHIEIEMEVPGLSPEDVDISLSEDSITVGGSKARVEHREGADYHISERRFGRFQRVLALPEGANTAKADAVMGDGILTITIPKYERSRRRKTKKLTIKSAGPAKVKDTAKSA